MENDTIVVVISEIIIKLQPIGMKDLDDHPVLMADKDTY